MIKNTEVIGDVKIQTHKENIKKRNLYKSSRCRMWKKPHLIFILKGLWSVNQSSVKVVSCLKFYSSIPTHHFKGCISIANWLLLLNKNTKNYLNFKTLSQYVQYDDKHMLLSVYSLGTVQPYQKYLLHKKMIFVVFMGWNDIMWHSFFFTITAQKCDREI